MRKMLFIFAALLLVAVLVGCKTTTIDETPTTPGDKIVGTENDAIAEDVSTVADDLNLEDIEALDEDLSAIEDLQLE